MGHYFEGVILEPPEVADALLPIGSEEPFDTQDVIDRLIAMGKTPSDARRAAKGLLLREDRAYRIALGLDGWSTTAKRHFGLPGRLGFLILIENEIVDHGASTSLDQMLARAFLPNNKPAFPAFTTSTGSSLIEELVQQTLPHWYVTPHNTDNLHWIELEGYLHALPFRNTRKGPSRSTFEYRGTPDWLTPSLPLAYAHALVLAAIKHERYDLLRDKLQYPDEQKYPIAEFLRSERKHPISSAPGESVQTGVLPPVFRNHSAMNLSGDATDNAADQPSAISQELSARVVHHTAILKAPRELSIEAGAKKPIAWNAGQRIGTKRALTGAQILSIRTYMDRDEQLRDRALFNLAIDSSLRGCDLVKIRIRDIVSGGKILTSTKVIQQRAGKPAQFDITPGTRESLLAWLKSRGGEPSDFVFPSQVCSGSHLSTRQFSRLMNKWVSAIGLRAENYGTHSLRRTRLSAGSQEPTPNLPAIALVEFEHGDLDLNDPNHAAGSALAFDDGCRFVTFEGGEGTGKSTQAEALCASLSLGSKNVILTREPGGTELAEAVRARILGKHYSPMGTTAEALAFSFARLEHMTTKILPALARGDWVVCDRFYDSTRAYQGAAGHVDQGFLDMLDSAATADRKPDLTIILDLPAEISLARAATRRGNAAPDRFEGEAMEFHKRLRAGFLEIAAKNPGRCRVIDCEGLSPLQVQQRVLQVVKSSLMGNDAGKILR